jgi:ATP-binding cassette subfamily B protein
MLIDKKEIPEDKLYEEVREEFCPKCGTVYPDSNRKVCPKCMDKRKIFFRLGSFFSAYKKELIIICILCILGALLSSVWPVLNGSLLYDGVLGKNTEIFPINKINLNDFSLLLLM